MNPSSPRVVWHASRADIPCPTLAGRTVGDNHDNSGLGLYCATAPHAYIAGFGGHVFALTLSPDVRCMRLPIAELARMGRGPEERDRAWFEAEGRRWGQACDVVELEEVDGQVQQVIVLNDAAITAVERYPAAEFLTHHAQADPMAAARRPPRP